MQPRPSQGVVPKKPLQEQNPKNRGGRPRDQRLGRAAALIDYVSVMAELRIETVNGHAPDKAPEALLELVENLSTRARTTGRLTLNDATTILAMQYDGHLNSRDVFQTGVKRYWARWKEGEDRPLPTAPRPRVICTCAHRHCAGPCTDWVHPMPPISCRRLIAEDSPWSLAEPCARGTTSCACRHVHCEGCGVGLPEHEPAIQPAYTCRIALNKIELEQWWIGWLCPDCMPEEFRSVASEVQPAPTQSPGCPRCGGNVVIDGTKVRCAGLSGEENRLRTAVHLEHSLRDKLMTPTGWASAEEHARFRAQQEELLRTLPATMNPLKPCGREGDVSQLVDQAWRRRASPTVGAQKRRSKDATK